MLFMNGLEFFLFRGFFVCIFKIRVEFGFLLNPPVDENVNSKRLESFVKLMSKNFISGSGIVNKKRPPSDYAVHLFPITTLYIFGHMPEPLPRFGRHKGQT
jgi:hypothetical protein